jgi:PAS domain S-box-containing protein
MKITIERAVLAQFIAGMVISTSVLLAIYVSHVEASRKDRWVIHTHMVLTSIEHLSGLLKDTETDARGYLRTGSAVSLQLYQTNTNGAAQEARFLGGLIDDNAVQLGLWDRQHRLVIDKLALLDEAVRLYDGGNRDRALTVFRSERSRQLTAEIQDHIARMESVEQGLLLKRNESAATASRIANWCVSAGWIVNFIVMLSVFRLVVREAARRDRVESALRASERRFRAIFEQTFQLGGLLDPQGTVLEANQTALDFGGLARGDVVGRPFWDTYWWSFDSRVQQRLQTAVADAASGKPVRYEDEMRGAGGKIAAIEFSLKPMRDESGQIIMLISEGRDISERKRAGQALHESEERFRLLVEGVRDYAIYMLDPDGLIVSWNSGAEVIKGYKADEVLGRHFSIFYPEELVGDHSPKHEIEIAEADGRFETEGWRKRKDGSLFWASVVITTLRAEDGSLRGFVKVTRDISERKRIDEELRQSEERFRATFDAAAAGMAIVAPDGRFALVNRSLCEIVGYTNEELLATTFQKITHPEDLDTDLGLLQHLTAGDIPDYRLEKRYLHKSGHEVWIMLSASVVRDSFGAPLHFVALIEDITPRKRAEDALRRQSELMMAVLDQMSDGVVVANEAGRFLLFNPAAEKILGAGALNASPSEWSDRYHLFLADAVTPFPAERIPLARAILGESIDGVEMFVREPGRPEGGAWISVNARPLVDSERIHRGGVAVFRDITERKKGEQELARRADELARSNAELEHFAYVASHDLQEPLRTVSGFTQLLARRYRGALDEKADQFIDFAVDGCNRMRQLIEDLLEYSRVNTRGRPFLTTDCEAILDRALANLKVTIEETGTAITHDRLPTISGDATQIGQLFQNLIANAIKFRSRHSPEVQISAAKSATEWTFSVTDNGIGIEPRYAEKVFVLFQRLHTRDVYPGTGIGLALCKKIVERHRGRIWFEPNPTGGTRFCFTIPR